MKELFKLTLPVFLVALATAAFGFFCGYFNSLVFAIIELGSIVTIGALAMLHICWFVEYMVDKHE